MNYYLEGMKKSFKFSGRTSRKEFWMFQLFNFLALTLLALIGNVISALSIIYVIYLLLIVVTQISMGIRRLHDLNKSGWWILINFIPFGGALWYFILCCLPGTPGKNNFGEVGGF